MEQLKVQPLVSIIVPVYNVKKYLACCLDSIISQTYQNLDIILINDGSTDGSGELCHQYKQRDVRIRLFEQENMGVSAARNIGLDNMKGNYVVFVDSDDYIAPCMIEVLLRSIQMYNVPVAICNSLAVRDKESKADFDTMPKNGEDFGKRVRRDEVFDCMEIDKLTRFIVVWGKMYDKKIFENIRFAVGKIYEDALVFHKIYVQTEEIYCIDLCLYAYRHSVNSITRKNGEIYHYVEGLREMGMERFSFFHEYGKPEYMRKAGKMLFHEYVYHLDWSNKRELKKKVSELEKEMNSITGKKIFYLRFAVVKYFPGGYQIMRNLYLKVKSYFGTRKRGV